MRKGLRSLILMIFCLCSLVALPVSAGGSDGVLVRVTGFNPATNEYTFSCTVPPSTPASQISPEKFYVIDPVPSYHSANRSFRSASSTVTWRLDPTNFEELVHTNAMYHIYCEVQNFSAPPGRQNLAS